MMLKKIISSRSALYYGTGSKMTVMQLSFFRPQDFKGGVSLPWHISESNEQNSYSKVENGMYVVHIDQKGTNKWDVQIRHRKLLYKVGTSIQ
jgi:endoglucanase